MVAATVGMAIGQNSGVTAEAAGVVVMDSSLEKVDEFMHISRRMRSVALQSAVGGTISQEVIDILAVLNARRAPAPSFQGETMPEQLDAIIIGTGQGGKPLAGALAEAGWTAAIIEKADRVGGTCVVSGCTPTKTMVASARVAYLARRAADYGVRTGPVDVDMAAVRKRKRDIVDSWSSGSRKGMERHETLELVMGHARFSGPNEVTVETHGGGTRVLTAEAHLHQRRHAACACRRFRDWIGRCPGQRVGHGAGRGARRI